MSSVISTVFAFGSLAPAAVKNPAKSTQSNEMIRSASRIRSADSGARKRPGGEGCSLCVVGNDPACFRSAVRIERSVYLIVYESIGE